MNPLIIELKHKNIECLNLLDVSPEDIDENGQLIGGDLGLDSIDVLELVMMLEKDYGIEIDSKELGIKVFASVAALADHVSHHRAKPGTGIGNLPAPSVPVTTHAWADPDYRLRHWWFNRRHSAGAA